MTDSSDLDLLVAVLSDTESELTPTDRTKLDILRSKPEFQQQLSRYKQVLEVAGAMVAADKVEQESVEQASPTQVDAFVDRMRPFYWKNVLLPIRIRQALENLLKTCKADSVEYSYLQKLKGQSDTPKYLCADLKVDSNGEYHIQAGEGNLSAQWGDDRKLRVQVSKRNRLAPFVVLLPRNDVASVTSHLPDWFQPQLVGDVETIVIENLPAGEYDLVAFVTDEYGQVAGVDPMNPDDSGLLSREATLLEQICFEVLDEQGRVYKTGFFITQDGYALTAHVDSTVPGTKCRIRYGGREYDAEVSRIDDSRDMVLLHVDGVNVRAFVPMSTEIPLRQEIVAGGYPHQSVVQELQMIHYQTHEYRTHYKVTLQDRRQRKCFALVPTMQNVRANPGNSGGPVLIPASDERKARLIGVVLAGQVKAIGRMQGDVMVQPEQVPYDWAMPFNDLFSDWPEFRTLLKNSGLTTAAEAKEIQGQKNKSRRSLFLGLGSVLAVLIVIVGGSFLLQPTRATGDFVIIRSNRAISGHASLAQAIGQAASGDVIELRKNGPQFIEPLEIRGKALTIRAAIDARPVLQLKPELIRVEKPLIDSDARIVLEGIELRRVGVPGGTGGNPLLWYIVRCKDSIYAAHCTFVLSPGADCIHSNDSPKCVFESCVFQGGHAVSWHPPIGGQLRMNNCLQVGGSAIHLFYTGPELENIRIELNNNTFIGIGERGESIKMFLAGDPLMLLHDGKKGAFTFTSLANVFDAEKALLKVTKEKQDGQALKASAVDQVNGLLSQIIAWREQKNIYRANFYLDGWGIPLARKFADWNRVWPSESGSVEATPIYNGFSRSGVLNSSTPLQPTDFALSKVKRLDIPAGEVAAPPNVGISSEQVGPSGYSSFRNNKQDYDRWLEEVFK